MPLTYDGQPVIEVTFNGQPLKRVLINGEPAFRKAAKLPVGAILPWNGGAAPSGWSAESSTEDRYIVGAGGSRASGHTRASDGVIDVQGTTTNGGGHTPGGEWDLAPYTNSGSTDNGRGPNVEDTHRHDFDAGAWTPAPARHATAFVRRTSTSPTTELPVGACVLRRASLSTGVRSLVAVDGLRALAGTGGGISAGDGGDAAPTFSVNLLNPGTHDHARQQGDTTPGFDTVIDYISSAGVHVHSATIQGVLTLRRALLLAYEITSTDQIRVGDIILYAGTSAPEGWLACNGSNGTPDLRDYYLHLTDDANDIGGAEDQTGENRAMMTLTGVSTAGAHSHSPSGQRGVEGTSRSGHSDVRGGHSDHDFEDVRDWQPASIALLPITPDPDAI